MDQVLAMEREFDGRCAELEPFDAATWIGYPASGRAAWPDATALAAALAAGPVRRALVSHTMSELCDAGGGNVALARALEALPGTYGVMTLLPPGEEPFDDLERTIDQYLDWGLRAVRVFPKAHRYSLKLPTIPRLFSALEDRGLPLFIQAGQTGWDDIGPLARDWPRLAILVEGIGHHEYLNLRQGLAWLEAAPNLLVPTSNQLLMGGLELLVKRLGVERMFFASNQPIESPWAALGPLAFSRLPLAARRRIAHGNLEQLLAGVGHGGYFA